MNNTIYNINTHPMLNASIKAIRKAGSIINRASLDMATLSIQTKADGSFVSEVDKVAQEEILSILKSIYPHHQFIAEEKHFNEFDPNIQYTWFIDPIDGTNNFIHGFDYYSISIAVAKNNNLEHACIYNPVTDELFTASRGKGAYLNNKRIRVSNRTKLSQALLATSFLHKKNITDTKDVELYLNIMQQVAAIRRTGSIALDLAYVAAGKFDAFFDKNLFSWDMAAGMLLVKEAGGIVGNFSGNCANDLDIIHQKQLLAGTPKVFASLVQHLE